MSPADTIFIVASGRRNPWDVSMCVDLSEVISVMMRGDHEQKRKIVCPEPRRSVVGLERGFVFENSHIGEFQVASYVSQRYTTKRASFHT